MSGRVKRPGGDESVDGAPSKSVPAHVAIIMDGNGRWARKHGWRRVSGHEEGAKSVREIITAAGEKKVRELTLFAFSTENWRRPEREVRFLMQMLEKQLVVERGTLMENNVRLRAIGRIHELPDDIQDRLAETVAMSAANTGLTVRLALNYGGRNEMVDAMRAIAADVREGRLAPEAITERIVRSRLYDPEMTDPDLLIRTGGEMRLSNFLLWWLSYTELYITDVCWPEFRRPQLEEAFAAYGRRQRRFGGVPEEDADVTGTDAPAVAAQSTVYEDPADQ